MTSPARFPTKASARGEAARLKERIVNFQKVQEKVWFDLYDEFENGDRVDELIEG